MAGDNSFENIPSEIDFAAFEVHMGRMEAPRAHGDCQTLSHSGTIRSLGRACIEKVHGIPCACRGEEKPAFQYKMAEASRDLAQLLSEQNFSIVGILVCGS